jgi:tetratricopeptide (TPR) repeat protein
MCALQSGFSKSSVYRAYFSGFFWMILLCGLPPFTSAQIADTLPPLIHATATEVPLSSHLSAFKIQMAEDALAEGLIQVAESLAEAVRAEIVVQDPNYRNVQRVLSTIYLQQGKWREVVDLISEKSAQQDIGLRLRRAIGLWQTGRTEEALALIRTIEASGLNASDLPWFYIFNGLRSDSLLQGAEAERWYISARSQVKNSLVAGYFDLLIQQRRMHRAVVTDAMINELETRRAENRGKLAGIETSRSLVVALYQKGNNVEALRIIDEQLKSRSLNEGDLRDQFLLLKGMIAGERSKTGRGALEQLLERNSARPDLQRSALYLLAKDGFAGEYLSSFRGLLKRLIASTQLPVLLDELLLLKARMEILDGKPEQAEREALRLLEEIPGSVLRWNALRVLAYVSWTRQPPQYRNAANYLNQIYTELTDAPDKAELGVMMADCFFLNGDYDRASEAYRVVMESQFAQNPGSVLLQMVLSDLRANRIQVALEHINRFAVVSGVDVDHRWMAEWNLLFAMKKAGDVQAAFKRIRELLEPGTAATLPEELRLRLLWMEIQLSVEVGDVANTPKSADELLITLASMTGDKLTESLRRKIVSHTLLIKGQAQFLLNETEAAQTTFIRLRSEYPDANSTLESYLIEARYLASMDRLVDAQRRFIALADRFPQSRYAPIALWEAALVAERRGLNSAFQEAITLLERMVNDYKAHELVFYARLKQADLSRVLNDFVSAQLIYEDLVKHYFDHPERYRAEISQADCLMAEASQNAMRRDSAIVLYERIADTPGIPWDLKAEVLYKLGFALSQEGKMDRVRETYWILIREAILKLSSDPATATKTEIEPQRWRYWISRAVFALGQILEQDRSFENARTVYTYVLQYKLPGQALAQQRIANFDLDSPDQR